MPRLRVEPSAYFGWCIALLILPIPWLIAAVLAAAFHEFCHFIAACALGITCREIRVAMGGMRMILPNLSRIEEWIIAAAGPLGSLFLLVFLRNYPQLAVSGFIQGIFNLLPIYPMDGGRILRCIMGNSDSQKISLQRGENRGTIGIPYAKR